MIETHTLLVCSLAGDARLVGAPSATFVIVAERIRMAAARRRV